MAKKSIRFRFSRASDEDHDVYVPLHENEAVYVNLGGVKIAKVDASPIYREGRQEFTIILEEGTRISFTCIK